MTPEAHDLLWLLNQYREGELRGAGAVLRMIRFADSADLRRDLTRHFRDEAAHALLWTNAIDAIGGELTHVPDPYQARLGAHFGIPNSLNELLALTLVSERRGISEYEDLAARDLPPAVHRVIPAILRDEAWHVEYIARELKSRAGDPDAAEALVRAEAADRAAIADLK